MAGTVEYTILNGVAPFSVELSPFTSTTHNATGTFEFINVPNGEYILTIVDSNDCEYEQTIVINPNITTTTTTTIPPKSIIVGHTEEPLLIFNQTVTNRSNQYNEGEFYLWLKTTDGTPLTQDIIVNYSFSGTNMNIYFQNLSDEVNAEVIENDNGPAEVINGQILLKRPSTQNSGFIETFFKYGTIHLDSTTGLEINLQSSTNWLNTGVQTTGGTNVYGITDISGYNVKLVY